MQKGSGVIEVVARNNKGIKIGDDWYGAFKVAQLSGAKKGDKVEFEYETVSKAGSDFHNIKGNVTIVGRSEAPASREEAPASRSGGSEDKLTARDRQIIRQNAMTQANTLLGNFYYGSMGDQGKTPEESAQEVIDIARMFEAYAAGEV